MAYTPQTWHNTPQVDTPLSAARLTVLENGIRDAHLLATATNVLTIGVKGDVVTVTDAAITTGTTALTSAAFTSADVGKRVQVIGAGASYNVRGAWVALTAYAIDDLVTFSGNTYIARQVHTSGATFTVNTWAYLPYAQTAKTLEATILSVSSGVATLDTAAGSTVSAATCTYGTDDSATCAALPAGNYYFPGRTALGAQMTYFVSEWFMASGTSVYSDSAVFKMPASLNSDASVFRLLTSNRSSSTMLSNIHLRGKYTIDMTELTPQVGWNVRGIHVLNCQDWSIDHYTAVGIPGDTGNALVVGSNQLLKTATRGRVSYVRNTLIRGIGSSCVQQVAGFDIWYGTLTTDGGCAGRFEMDGHAGDKNENLVVDLAHHSGSATSLMVNSAVTLKAHTNAMSNVRIGTIISEGVADALGVGYDAGGSIENVLIQRLRASGGGTGLNINNNTNTFPNFVMIGASTDACGSATIYRSPKSNPGTAYCLAPGMTLIGCKATNSTASGFKDIFQTSIVTGSKVTLIDCEATSNAFNGVAVDKIENVFIQGGRYTSNGSGGFGGSAGVNFYISGSPDTRSNTPGVIQSGNAAAFSFAVSTPALVNAVAASGAAQTLPDVFAATAHRLVLTANCTLTFPAAAAGKSFKVSLVQDATGSRTVTWPGAIKWVGGVAPTLTTTATKLDLLEFTCLDGTNWLGIVQGQNL